MFDLDGFDDHESLHVFNDPATGLRAAIAVHSTARGPSAGGCRVWNYPDAAGMMSDALRLSQAMSFKSAMADLPLGGGKAVVWAGGETAKTAELLSALGKRIHSLDGRYRAACDIGMTPADLVHIRKETPYVAGLIDGPQASGDSAPATARGIYLSMLMAAERVFGNRSLRGVRIAIQGVGKVGRRLCALLERDGAILTVCDVDQECAVGIARQHGAAVVAPDDIYDVEADIFSPNGVGGTISGATAERLKAKLIVGGANNQLADADTGSRLHEAGIVYAPDYVVNGGGIINLAGEILSNYDPEWVEEKLEGLATTLGEVLETAARENAPPERIADRISRKRIAAAGIESAIYG